MDFRTFLALFCALCNLHLATGEEIEVRLVNGKTRYEGRLEVRKKGDSVWGTVCDDNFDKHDAAVVCRMLGLNNSEHATSVTERYGAGVGDIVLDEMECFGNESNLSECKHDDWGTSNCAHSEDVGVSCQTPVKLTGDEGKHVGMVNVQVNKRWQPMCYTSFNVNVGTVLCRMLGLSTGNVEVMSEVGHVANISTKQYMCNGTEKDISQCDFKEKKCDNSTVAKINCHTAVRLVGGPNKQAGRVEVFLQDRWGAVCDNFFKEDSASVVCRMLGYSPKYAKAYGRSHHGNATQDIIVDGLKCSGSETDISECKTTIWGSNSTCNPTETASVKCATTARLANGPTEFSGRLELKYGSVWKSVCDQNFDKKTATVICRMLNYERGNITVHKTSYYGKGTNTVIGHGWSCAGNETDISDCDQVNSTTTCNNSNEVGINCFSYTPVRLVGGPTVYSGRVEVFMPLQSKWMGVCYNNMSVQDASVLCSMIGKPNSAPHIHNATELYKYVIRGEALGQLNCNGTEKDITECRPYLPWNQTYCTYPDYAGINCDPITPVRLVEGPSVKAGRVEVQYNGTWGGVCASELSTREADVMCEMLGFNQTSYILDINEYNETVDNITINGLNCTGGESDISDCRAERWNTGVCSDDKSVGVACKTRLRLVNGTTERSGRVEIWHNGTWNTICADNFDEKAANVTCKMVGFRFWNATVLQNAPFGLGTVGPILDRINCTGNESDLASCQSSPWETVNCRSRQVASVHCDFQDTPIRLIGSAPYSGRVEIFHYNRWGTVCRSGFSKKEAMVICRKLLGEEPSPDIEISSPYYTDYTRIMIRNLACSGNESDISMCSSDDWGSGHKGCTGNRYTVYLNCLTPVSLIGGRTNYMGIVEVTHNNRRSSICSENFSNENAIVICSMLGFNFTTNYIVSNETFHTDRTSPGVISGVACNGTEKDIQTCRSDPWESGTCTTNNKATVNCNTPIRLSDGLNWRSGRIEVMLNDSWAELCYSDDEDVNKNNGRAVCGILGFSGSIVTISDEVTSGIAQVNLTCNGEEDDISRCIVLENTCSTRKCLRITCNTNIKLVYGRTDFMGAVSVKLHGGDGVIQYIHDDVTAGVVCRILGYTFNSNAKIQQRSAFKYKLCVYENINRLKCDGNETDIMDCKNSYWSQTREYSCYTSSPYIGVNCQTPIRLTNGSTYQYGIMEVKHNSTWYPVCYDSFSLKDAEVVCRMLGHNYVKNSAWNKHTVLHANFVSYNFTCTGNESDISHCSYKRIISSCPSGGVVHIDCRSHVRLVDGPTAYRGRPEIEMNGKYQPFCSYSYSHTYTILCKMLGFNYNGAIQHSGKRYSNKTFNPSDFFSSNNLQCYANNNNSLDEDITECSATEWFPNSTCSYSTALEIECNTPIELLGSSNKYIGMVRVSYSNTYKSVCGDNFTSENADVICREIGIESNGTAKIYYGNKFGSLSYDPMEGLSCLGNETDLQECHSLPWSAVSNNCSKDNSTVAINCRPNTPIRLSGTSDNSSGIVEINYENRWGSICSYSFDVKDASVICRMLGYKIGEVGPLHRSTRSDITMSSLSCDGTEDDISECSSNWYPYRTPTCENDSSATVNCSNDRVRIVGVVNDYRGRVEFQYMGVWGSICDEHFDVNDAAAVCREIGLDEKNASIFKDNVFGYLSTSLIVDDLNCTGNEQSIDQCDSFPWKTASYTCPFNHRSVGVNCKPNTPLILVNGGSGYKGRIEIGYKGSNGTICDREFDHNDAKVVCRMLGFNTMSVEVRRGSYFGKGSGNIIISHLRCNGQENDISDCPTPYRWNSPYEYCNHDHDVSVECDTPVRLRGGLTDYDGMVEVYINDSWKGVCRNEFTQSDAEAVCNITGSSKNYKSNKPIVIHDASYYGMMGDTKGLITLLNCSGKEDDLYFCGSGKWTVSTDTCSTESVAINCRPETQVRLVDNNGPIDVIGKTNTTVTGRIEVMYRDTWGTICDDKFDDNDAHVLCAMLNFTVGKVNREGKISAGIGSINIDDLECRGTERDISECKSKEWGQHNCEHSEDVVITCDDIHNIDPCRPKDHKRLPNLELRYAKSKNNKSVDDSKLAIGWYNVGNNTMPRNVLSLDRCGSHFPIYSDDTVLGMNGSVYTITATQFGDPSVQYEILVKHCIEQGFYVNRLEPTKTQHSGYCFGIGTDEEPPSFVPDKVITVMESYVDGIKFHCKFTPEDENKEELLYQVKWTIVGNYDVQISKQYYNRSRLNELDLTEVDFETYGIGLGINVSCAVRSYKTAGGAPGPLSLYSKPYFAGLKIENKEMSLRKGETKSIVIENTVPLTCLSNFDYPDLCFFQLDHMIPSDDTCNSKGSFSSRACSAAIRPGQRSTTINITTSETGQYGTYGHFQVHLALKGDPNYNIFKSVLWQQRFKLPTVNVEVFPEEDRSWRKTICSARNDPHMQTFDNKLYEHHQENKGVFILYRHKTFTNVEIQHKIASCVGTNSHAKCNCGVAVRAGGDVYVIDVCEDNLEIGHRRCEDEALTVKKDNDFTYTIYLPYGTAVRARIDNQPWMGNEGGKIVDITVLPSLHDNKGMTSGLCGTLNNNTDDDFKHRNETHGIVNESVTFIDSWKALPEEDLFNKSMVKKMSLERWSNPSCICQHTKDASSPLTCDRSMAECTPGSRTGEHSCGGLSSLRTRRSVSLNPIIPVVRQSPQNPVTNQHSISKRAAEDETVNTIWTNETATKYCADFFDVLKTYQLCKKVPATHTSVSVQNCVLDILLSNSTEWIKISRQSMQDTCTTEIHRNATVRQEAIANITRNVTKPDESGDIRVHSTMAPVNNTLLQELEEIETAIKEIKELSCLNNCSGHGECLNGVCQCESGHGSSDCSLDETKAPTLSGILDNGFCDENDTDCTHIYVFGSIFFGTNVTCRLQKFTFGVNETATLHNNTIHIKGTADTLIEAMCPIHQVRRKRSVGNDKPFAFGYKVSVSNDGEHFSNETLTTYIFNSQCQFLNNATAKITFHLKDGYCHIDGSCYSNGTVQQKMMCNTNISKFNWTPVTTTTSTTTSTTTTKSSTLTSTTPSPTESVNTGCSCNKKNNQGCNGTECICKAGWSGPKCEADIDECSTIGKSVCSHKNNSGCQNSPGNYTCLCLRNYEETDKGECKESKTDDPVKAVDKIVGEKPDRESYRLEIHIDILLDDSKNLNVSDTYQDYVIKTKEALMGHYRQRLGISLVDVVIISLKSGSLIVDHSVIVKKTEFSVKALSVAITDFSSNAKLNIDGHEYGVQDVKIEKSQVGAETDQFRNHLLCDSYTALNPCEEDESCVVEKDAPICKRTATNSDKETTQELVIIITSTVGGVLLLVVLVLVCVLCRSRQAKKDRLSNHTSSTEENEYHHVNTTEMVEIPRAKVYSGSSLYAESKLSKPDTAHDNPTFKHDENDPRSKQSKETRSNYESDDGYVYYFGKKK